jgi:hypothetical protein
MLRPLRALVGAGQQLILALVFPHPFFVLWFALRHLIVVAMLAGAALGYGRGITPLLGDADDLEQWSASMVLGLGTVATLIFALGVAGLLRPAYIWLLFALPLASLRRGDVRYALEVRRGYFGNYNWRHLVLVAAGMVALGPLISLALYPPTGFDATMYHLPYAREFAGSGRLVFAAGLRYPVFPQLNEMLFTAMLLVSDDVSAQLVQSLATLLTALILVAWGRRVTTVPAVGWLAAGLWLGSPLVVYFSASAYIECGLALFFTAALWACERWRETEKWGWLIIAAASAGFAAATKYTGLLAVVVVLVLCFGRPLRHALRAFAVALLGSLLVAFPWYARIFWLTRNPVFPFLTSMFGDNPWVLVHAGLAAHFAHFADWLPGWLATIVLWLTAPVLGAWNLIAHRKIFGQLPPISPVYLASLPLLCLVPFRRRQMTPLVLLVAFSLGSFAVPRSSHYLIALMPVWSLIVALGCGIVIRMVTPRRPTLRRQAVLMLGVLFFSPGWLYVGYRMIKLGDIPTTQSERDAHLSAQLPSYPAILFLNRSRGQDYRVYGIFSENMMYFARGCYLGDWNGPAAYRYVIGNLQNSCVLQRRLRKVGVNYLLVPTADFPSAVPQDDCFHRYFHQIFADHGARVFAVDEVPSPPPER